MSHWPQGWAERGDAHSKVSNRLEKIQKELFYRFRLPQDIHLEVVEKQPQSGRYIARHVHTESYPSGGSAEYAKFAYWNGREWHEDAEWRHSGPRSMDNPRIEWFRIVEQ